MRNPLLKCTRWMFSALLCMATLAGQAQTESAPAPPLYYLDVNQAHPNLIHEIQEGTLALQYEDRYGEKKEVTLTLYTWQRQPVGRYELSKTYGMNYFRIELGEAFASWPVGQVCTAELSDESGKSYALSIRKIAPPVKATPTVKLIANPIHVSCQTLQDNLVEFYGEISGGKAPYQVSWYVLNEARTDFLYQPRQQQLEKEGNTLLIQVDKQPNYYVMLHVQDACGMKRNQMIYLTCHQQKKINSVLVEPILLQHLPTSPQPSTPIPFKQ